MNQKKTPRQNYASLVDQIFGIGTVTGNLDVADSNTILDELNSLNNQVFWDNFHDRLTRLEYIYREHPSRQTLKDKIELVMQPRFSDWIGAFSEIVALDHFHRGLENHDSYLREPIQLDYPVDHRRTFAAGWQRSGDSKLDGYFRSFDIYFDVKCFQGIIANVLNRMYRDIYKECNNLRFQMRAEYPQDLDCSELVSRRKRIICAVVARLARNDKPSYFRIKSFPKLEFRFQWQDGALLTAQTYNPYCHAQEIHAMPFGYCRQFVKNRPFFLVYVDFPWFNSPVSGLGEFNKIFYRAFARRVFFQYRSDPRKYSTIKNEYVGEETVFELSKKLAGIVFLEDKSLTCPNFDCRNVKSFLYFNPLADNPIHKSIFANEYLRFSLGAEVFEDFEYDNY